MGNRLLAYAKTKAQISFAVTVQLISACVSATLIVQSLYFLNWKFKASSHLLWLYSPVCVGPGRKPRRPVFSQRGSFASENAVSISTVNQLFCGYSFSLFLCSLTISQRFIFPNCRIGQIMQVQCTVCLYGHFRGDFFSQIFLSLTNTEREKNPCKKKLVYSN